MNLRQDEWTVIRSLFDKTPHCAHCPYRVTFGDFQTGVINAECSLGTTPYDRPSSCTAFKEYLFSSLEPEGK